MSDTKTAEGFTFDAEALIRSRQFVPSGMEAERAMFVTAPPVEEALTAFAKVYDDHQRAYRQYERLRAICGQADMNHPVMLHFEAKVDERSSYWSKLDALDDRIMGEALECIAEALNLVGVTDPATVCEVCRVVIRGGEMWDGYGFTQGEAPTLTPEVKPDTPSA